MSSAVVPDRDITLDLESHGAESRSSFPLREPSSFKTRPYGAAWHGTGQTVQIRSEKVPVRCNTGTGTVH
jgi:hypothetical protein